VADYEGDVIDPAEAEKHVSFAEELLAKSLQIIPANDHPPVRDKSTHELLAATIAEESAKHALAKAFCELAMKQGESVHPGLESELVLYGSEQDLNDLVVNVAEMTDLKSYLKSKVTLPSLG
jgi:hypothetical protein